MKIAFITDIHAHAFNDYSRNVSCYWDEKFKRFTESDDGDIILNSRLLNILNGLCDVRDYCVDNEIEYVLNGGDTFHRRTTIDVTTFNSTYKVLESFKECGIEQVIISGNHDNAINADNSPSSVETFRNFATVFTDLGTYELPDGTVVACVPWLKEKKRALQFMKENQSHSNILMAHLGVSGASLGSGYIMSDDYSLSELKPDKWHYVLLGHYHKPQMLTDTCLYGGSLLQNDFGDEGDYHGFFVIDTSKRWDIEMIPLEYPVFKTLYPDTIDDYDKDSIKHNFIRVQTTAKDVDKVQDSLGDISDVRIDVEKDYTKEARSDISVTMTYDDIVKTYVEETNASEDCDNDTLIRTGVEILRKVGGKL
jgi:DNA repair exonuclease SbcCD nuclease subunit